MNILTYLGEIFRCDANVILQSKVDQIDKMNINFP